MMLILVQGELRFHASNAWRGLLAEMAFKPLAQATQHVIQQTVRRRCGQAGLLRQLAQLRSQQQQLSDQARATETALQAQLVSAARAAKEADTRLEEAKLAVRRGQEREAALGIQLEESEEARAQDDAF